MKKMIRFVVRDKNSADYVAVTIDAISLTDFTQDSHYIWMPEEKRCPGVYRAYFHTRQEASDAAASVLEPSRAAEIVTMTSPSTWPPKWKVARTV